MGGTTHREHLLGAGACPPCPGAGLPVPVFPYGPFGPLFAQARRIGQIERPEVALETTEAYLAITRAAGDEQTTSLLLLCAMYRNLDLDRLHEAQAIGEEVVRRYHAAGFVPGEAKALADLAETYQREGRVLDGMRCLARSILLLDEYPLQSSFYAFALSSVADAAEAAELYEIADEAHARRAEVARKIHLGDAAFMRARHGDTLLFWGLRLHQLGGRDAGGRLLRRAVELYHDYVAGSDGQPNSLNRVSYQAALALAVAKLGGSSEALRLAGDVVVTLRNNEKYCYARMAHLALGIALRAEGDLAAARRELVAHRQLCALGGRVAERLIVQHEFAELAVAVYGARPSRDLRATVAAQAKMLWELRLQHVAMLRQARQREELDLQRDRAEREMMRDPLTGLGNRRCHDQLVAAINAGHLAPPLALLLIDVDRLKEINDICSHSAGDQALREVAAILQANCRAGDVAARYAGDEFTVFLHCQDDEASLAAERIRAAVAAAGALPGTQLSVSTGVAMLRPGMTGEDLFRTADQRLYAAKEHGRNRVAV